VEKVAIHPTAVEFGQKLNKELAWLKTNHPDKLALIHITERFFEFLADNTSEKKKREANNGTKDAGAIMQ